MCGGCCLVSAGRTATWCQRATYTTATATWRTRASEWHRASWLAVTLTRLLDSSVSPSMDAKQRISSRCVQT